MNFMLGEEYIDMGILSYKILLRQDDNENFFVATITTKKTITTMKNLDQNSTKKGSFVLYSYKYENVSTQNDFLKHK